MFKSDTSIYRVLFLILLLINGFLRFYEIGTFSLSNDELSAIARLNVAHFQDLISKGVMETDPHPAGTQVFLYYWTWLFGNTVFSIRFPFVLAGLLALIFMHATLKMWFGERAALLSTAFFSMSIFSIVHGQLARPYPFGLLFSMMFVWSWSQVLFNERHKKYHLMCFVISGSLSFYTHYYAALLVGIIGLSGLYEAYRQKQLKGYVLLGIAMFLLMMPHLPVTINQLGRGPLTSWIPLADSEFFWSHIQTLNNNSTLLIFVSALALFLSLWRSFRTEFVSFQWYALIFFLVPMVFGYLYSQFVGSALMDRVLYFSSPFFFALVFSNVPDLKKSRWILMFISICALTIWSSLVEKHLFRRQYVEHFKELAQELDGFRKDGGMHPFLAGNFNSPDYINYYLDPDVEFEISSIDSDKKLAVFMDKVRRFSGSHLSLFWACSPHPIAINEYTMREFPKVTSSRWFYNSAFWNFEKTRVQRDTLLKISRIGDIGFRPETEFFEILKSDVSGLNGCTFINVRVVFSGQAKGTLLVLAQSDSDGNLLRWEGHKLNDFVLQQDENELFSSFKIPENAGDDDVFNWYLWNSEGQEISLKSIEVYGFNDLDYTELY